VDRLDADGFTGSGEEAGMASGQRVRTPSKSVHAKRFWEGENARCVITASGDSGRLVVPSS
jgi:hypothetical protein